MEFEAEKKKMLDVYHRSKEQTYAFDKIFTTETHEDVIKYVIINNFKRFSNRPVIIQFIQFCKAITHVCSLMDLL